jgi:outer membrane protein, multidrug efflux system
MCSLFQSCQIHTLRLWMAYALVWMTVPGCAHWAAQAPQTAVFESEMAVPEGWAAAQAAGNDGNALRGDSLTTWWNRFNDPLMSEIVDRALLFNTSVAKAQAALSQAQALRDVAAASLLPVLGASGSVQRGTSGGNSTGNRFQVGLDGQWVPDVFGARRNALDASNAVLAASAATLGDVHVQVAAEVALNYIVLRSSQARWLIASNNLESQKETLQITDWRQQAGLITMLEVERARAAVAQTQTLLPALQISSDQTAHALAVLVGQPPAALKAWLGGSPSMTSTAMPPVVAIPQSRVDVTLDLPAETLRQRADVRAAEYQVVAAIARVGQAQAQRWPSFAIGGSLGLSAISVAALTKGVSVLSSLLASISLPVFDGGAARAQVRGQQAALGQVQALYRAAILGALKDVENALVALRGDRERLVSLRIAADAAGNAALLARQRYLSGLVDFQTVLETQRTQLSTQDAVVSANADISTDQVRLFTALGGGWRLSDAQLAAQQAATQ